MNEFDNVVLAFGVDTLYYYAQSNDRYSDRFYDLEAQLKEQMKLAESDPYAYAHSAMIVKLGEHTLQYLKKAQGVHWFRDVNEYFKIGFLNPTINSFQHSKKVQLLGNGIYTVGMKALLAFINEDILKEITTGLFEISRGDINVFCQYDFGFVTKEMFVSKKKNYHVISEYGNAKRTQTIYVGKTPFYLRLYDKKLELKKSSKKEIMDAYFTHLGFDLDAPIYNLEFEMHRVHFKKMSIRTLEGFLCNIENLFKHAMNEIRLIDLSSITQKDIKNNSKNRAKTLPIWDYIKERFHIESFMQYSIDLERLPQKRYAYDLPKFITAIHEVINKALLNKLPINSEMIYQIADRAIDMESEPKEKTSLEPINTMHSQCDVLIHDKENDLIARYHLTKENELVPYKLPFALLDTKELEYTIKRLDDEMLTSSQYDKDKLAKRLRIAHNELQKRKGVKDDSKF